MIASWMLYCLAISMLLSIAGVAVERALASRGWPVRFVWVATLALSLAWPLAPMAARLLPTPPRPVRVMPFTIVVDVSPAVPSTIDRAAMINKGLVGAWIALSLLLAFRLAHATATLEHARRAWQRGRVNGVRVKLSENVGPAVVGLRTMEVVLPKWILSLDESLRAIVLRHEEEHRSARDPYLLFGAAVLVALMPWNAALWFQARRLRLAIEMDCDARVLRAHPSPERYGMLILTIAQRRSVSPVLFAPMLTEPTTNLERRILAMRSTGKMARLTMYGGSVVAVAILAFASSLQSAPLSSSAPRMQQLLADAAKRIVPTVVPAVLPDTDPPAAATRKPQEVRKLDSVKVSAERVVNSPPRYPALLRAAGVEGATIARFTTDRNGNVDPTTIAIVTSTNDQFSISVRQALLGWHSEPNMLHQIPFVFVMADKSGKELALPGAVPEGAVVISAAPVARAELPAGFDEVPVERPRAAKADQTYFEFQVEKPVGAEPMNPPPRYPDMLRAANVEGDVLAQFVVNTDGTADMSTFKVLKSSHELFTESVRSALPNMKFNAAQVGGRPVKQLVQMPFAFSLSKGTP